MGWENVEWACGHTGDMQLYGKMDGRYSRVAYEAGKKCLACWLIEQWVDKADPRANNLKRWELAKAIAKGKSIRIDGDEFLNDTESIK